MPFLPERTVPLDEHETSYFADSASIRSFSIVFSVSMGRYFSAKVQKNSQTTSICEKDFALFGKCDAYAFRKASTF
jgi:hypothetical protein